jgi:hypothetical protein
MVMMVLAIWTQNRAAAGCRVDGLKFVEVLTWRSSPRDVVFCPVADALSLSKLVQWVVPLMQRQAPPAAPRLGQALTGALSVACTRADKYGFNLERPVIAGVNECGGLFLARP